MKHKALFLILLSSPFLHSQEIKFKKSTLKFGFVTQGDTVRLEYEFKNKGDKPLIITDYAVECGCTVMEKPTGPINPGESAFLKVSFDTHEKYDRQDRTIKVISNAVNSPSVLRFKGVVRYTKKKF
jgi:hypothetical protein